MIHVIVDYKIYKIRVFGNLKIENLTSLYLVTITTKLKH